MTAKYQLEIKGQNEHTVRFRIKEGEKHLSFKEVFDLWQHNSEFIVFYKNELIKLNYLAFYWEHPALNQTFLSKKYECILQRSKPLEHLAANETAFKEHLFLEEGAADFMNLGNNARLIVPTKQSEEEIYNHLGRFIRLASNKQIIEVFNRLGKAVLEEIERQKIVWLNTAGLGVIWLHIRIDTRPKYYKTKRYQNSSFLNQIN